MSYLIDTNVISEVRKRSRCDPHVASWYATVRGDELYLSVVVLGEIRTGVELARAKDPAKARALEAWLGGLELKFGDRVFAINRDVSEQWGRMRATRPIPTVDGLLGLDFFRGIRVTIDFFEGRITLAKGTVHPP